MLQFNNKHLLRSMLLLSCILLVVDVLRLAWDKNVTYAQYIKVLQGYNTDVDAVIGNFLRLPTIQNAIENKEACYLENLYAYAAYQASRRDFQSFESVGDCHRLLIVGDGRYQLPLINFHSDLPLYTRETSELEFRRNVWARMGIVIMSSGLYEIGMQARCMGPAPALVNLSIADNKCHFSYENEPAIHTVDVGLDRGVHWIEIAFTNDSYTEAGDRNLRLMEVWIEQKSESK
jgi:hypothetical protein